MSIQDLISIVNKGENEGLNNRLNKVHHDLFNELSDHIERISLKYNYHPSRKVTIEVYPALPSFHQAVGEAMLRIGSWVPMKEVFLRLYLH